MFTLLATFVTRRPWMVIALIALAALMALAGARHLHFVSDFDSSLPNRSPLSAQIHAIQDTFESRNTLAFLVRDGTPAARVAAACTLSQGLTRLPGIAAGRVYGVGSPTVKYLADDRGDLVVNGLDQLCTNKAGLSAAVRDGLGPQASLVQAPDGSLTVYADVAVASGTFGPLLEKIDAIIAGASRGGVTIAYSGQPAFLAQNDLYSKRIAYFFPVIMALILILHWEALRSMQAVVVPIFTGLTATLIGLGLYGWFGLPLDTYTVLAPVLILAVGAGHSVQLLKRYMEEVRSRTFVGEQASREANAAAIVATMAAQGPVLTIAVAGAATCLFSLLLLDVSALARFGLLAGLGLIAALVLELTVVPAIRMLLRRPVMRPGYGDLSPMWQGALRCIAETALTGPAGRIALGLAIGGVVLAIGVSRVAVSHSMAIYTAPDVPVQRTVHELTAAGVGPYVMDVMIDTGRPDGAFDPAAQSALLGLEDRMAADEAVRAVLSPAGIIRFLGCRFAGTADCAAAVAASADESRQIWTVLFGGGRAVGLIDDTGRYLRLRAFVATDETRVATRLIDTVEGYARDKGLAVSIGGSAVTAKALADGIVRVSLEKAALLLVIVMIIGGLVFRSWVMALLFLIPSALTIATNFAWLGWSGTTLNVATAAVATIAVGVGLDYLIYFTFRIREALDQRLGYLDAIRVAHASAGGAAVCVAMAVAVGYVVLLASPGYLVHHWIAVLVPITMLASLVGTLFVFPFALRLLRPRFTPRFDAFSDWNQATAELLPMVAAEPAPGRAPG